MFQLRSRHRKLDEALGGQSWPGETPATRILLFLILTLAVWAAPGTPVEVVRQFEQSCSQARSWQDVQAYFSAATNRALQKLTPAQQAQSFQQARAEQIDAPNPKVEETINGKQARVRLEVEVKTGPDLHQQMRTYDLDLENGQWKIDFQDALEIDAD